MFSIRVNGNHGCIKRETLKEIIIEAKKTYHLFNKDVFIHENGEHLMTLINNNNYGTLELTCNCQTKKEELDAKIF